MPLRLKFRVCVCLVKKVVMEKSPNVSRQFALYSHRARPAVQRPTAAPVPVSSRFDCCMMMASSQSGVDQCVAKWLSDDLPPLNCSERREAKSDAMTAAYKTMVLSELKDVVHVPTSNSRIRECAKSHAHPSPVFFKGFADCVRSTMS